MSDKIQVVIPVGENSYIEHGAGGTSFVGKEAVNVYRLHMIKRGLEAEMIGMRLTRKAPSCFSIVKREYGLKGRDKRKVYEAFCAMFGFEPKPA